MRIYKQKKRTQGKLPMAMNIFILGIVSINLAGLPVASIVLYFIIKKKVKQDMPILLKEYITFCASPALTLYGKPSIRRGFVFLSKLYVRPKNIRVQLYLARLPVAQ